MNIDIKKFLDYILRQKKYSLNTYKQKYDYPGQLGVALDNGDSSYSQS